MVENQTRLLVRVDGFGLSVVACYNYCREKKVSKVERKELMAPVGLNTLVSERYDAPSSPQATKHGALDLPPLEQKLSKKEKSFLDLAVRLAETSDVDLKHGAVIVKNGRVLSLGQNKWRNRDLKQADNEWEPILTTHAEMDALSRVADARGAVVYIGRVDDNGARKFSRPCWRCMDALHEAGVKRVVYTTS